MLRSRSVEIFVVTYCFSSGKKGGEALILEFAKTKWNGMIREPSLMSQEIKPMDLMEVIKVCFFLFFIPSFFFSPRFHHHTIVRRVSVSC